MFYPIFLLATLILALVNASALTNLDKETNNHNLIAANAAFYASESNLEENQLNFKKQKEFSNAEYNSLIRAFHLEKENEGNNSGSMNMGNFYIDVVQRNLSETPKKLNQTKKSKAFDEFRFINVSNQNNFQRLNFDYEYEETGITDNGVIIDVIIFPRENLLDENATKINFGSVKKLSTKYGDISRTVKRVMFHSMAASTSSAKSFVNHDKNSGECGQAGFYCNIEIRKAGSLSSNKIIIENLDPQLNNYIVRFQTINKKRVFYQLKAENFGQEADLELTNQFIEIDSETAINNMYQRIKHQQRSFAPLQPGLDFVLFSDQPISK